MHKDRAGKGVSRVSPLVVLALLLSAVKAAELALDSTPLLFFDSEAFVLNGLGRIFFPVRSYVYGYLIRLVAVPFHSLRPLVVLQVVMGGLTAWLLGFLLIRQLRVPPWIAIASALLFAVDPEQIVHERLVVTETAALLVVALFLVAAASYLSSGSLVRLVLVSLLGVVLVSLRIAFLPPVLLAAVALPFTTLWSSKGSQAGAFTAAILVSCGSAATFHLSYMALTGHLAHREPAYHYMTGFFGVADLAPLLNAEEAAQAGDDPHVVEALREQDRSGLPLAMWARSPQLWDPDGLVERLKRAVGNDAAADRAAQRLARETIMKHPFRFLMLGMHEYASYWRELAWARDVLRWENGSAAPIPPTGASLFHEIFGIDAANLHSLESPARRYHAGMKYWPVLLLLGPVLAILACWLSGADRALTGFLALWSVTLMATVCLTGGGAVYRYLHPMSFSALTSIALMLARGFKRRMVPWQGM